MSSILGVVQQGRGLARQRGASVYSHRPRKESAWVAALRSAYGHSHITAPAPGFCAHLL